MHRSAAHEAQCQFITRALDTDLVLREPPVIERGGFRRRRADGLFSRKVDETVTFRIGARMGHRPLLPGRLARVLGVLHKNAIPEQEDTLQRHVLAVRGNQTGVKPESFNLPFKGTRLTRFLGGRVAEGENKQEGE